MLLSLPLDPERSSLLDLLSEVRVEFLWCLLGDLLCSLPLCPEVEKDLPLSECNLLAE